MSALFSGILGAIPGFLIFLALVYVIAGLFVRACAFVEFYWVFIPANQYLVVVSKENVSTDLTQGGGTIIRVLHEVSGHKLATKSIDNMEWKFTPGVEKHGLLHKLYGVQRKGLFTAVRTNLIKSTRYGRPELDASKASEEGKTIDSSENRADMIMYAEDQRSKYIWFSAQQAVQVPNAETSGTFALDIKYNIMFERMFPVKAILRVADAQATLTEMAQGKTIAETGQHKPEYFLSGPAKAKDDLAREIESISSGLKGTEEELGIHIRLVTFFSVDPSVKERDLRALLELNARTKREQAARVLKARADKKIVVIEEQGKAEAQIIQAQTDKKTKVFEAQGDRKAGLLKNDVPADFAKRVTIPIAQTPNGDRVRFAEAYENNETVIVSGANPFIQLPAELLKSKSSGPKKPKFEETVAP